MGTKRSDYKWVTDAIGRRHRVMKGAEDVSLIDMGKERLYNPRNATRSIELYGDGLTFNAIASVINNENPKAKPISGAEIRKWMTRHNDFKQKMKAARECRAIFAEDKVIEAAEDADQDNIQAQRLKVEAYKWVAEVNGPETYGKKTKIVGDPDAPVTFIIDTGIRRDPLPEENTEKIVESVVVPSVALPSNNRGEA